MSDLGVQISPAAYKKGMIIMEEPIFTNSGISYEDSSTDREINEKLQQEYKMAKKKGFKGTIEDYLSYRDYT